MNSWLCSLLLLILSSCVVTTKITWPDRNSNLTGTEFYKQSFAYKWKERDSFAVKEVLAGNIPGFMKKFVPVTTSIPDSVENTTILATYYVSPDYLSIGTDADWARIPLTPMAAQQLADRLNCFLPTRKMVNDIYQAAVVKLEPVPMYAFRDSTVTMWHHHLIVEGQRKGRRGLITGIKKDVVISDRVSRSVQPGRVAIYGWHKPDGKPIQPLYTGHVNWWVDYSHGIRFVYRMIRVREPGRGERWINYQEVLKDPKLRRLLCDEEHCDFFGYW